MQGAQPRSGVRPCSVGEGAVVVDELEEEHAVLLGLDLGRRRSGVGKRPQHVSLEGGRGAAFCDRPAAIGPGQEQDLGKASGRQRLDLVGGKPRQRSDPLRKVPHWSSAIFRASARAPSATSLHVVSKPSGPP